MNWPASFVVARAYVDQLTRTKGIDPARAAAVETAMAQAEKGGTQKQAALDELDTLTTQLDKDAGAAANPRDAAKLQTLAATIRVHAAALK